MEFTNQFNPDTRCHHITVKLAVNTTEVFDPDYEGEINEGDRLVEFKMVVHESFFKPLSVNVNIPEELLVNEEVEAVVEEIQVPVVLEPTIDNEEPTEIQIELIKAKDAMGNVLCMLKKRLGF